ncbi:MAG TPA: biotin-independent malonate decarboxylase subunit beta [Steroidobacteraceae bacterium]|nr:biotin-independent malonate decarboxylase subunit beta [Steroidobacteraceae bacterium]
MLDLPPSWYELGARARIAGILDADSFIEFLGPEVRAMSPHLQLFALPPAFDDGIVVGRGQIGGRAVLLAAQEGRFLGGAIGEVHGAKLTGLLRGAAASGADVLILFDTGGVRLQEANAGEVAVAEIMRAALFARAAGSQILGLIGGRAGCFGGGGLIAACCSRLIMSEQGRMGVTGPEVIESNRGVEEFDASDRALVWRTYGGKHRRLTGGVDLLVEDDAASFRQGAIGLLDRRQPFDLSQLDAEHARLARRLARCGDTRDAQQMWTRLNVTMRDIPRVPDMTVAEFTTLAAALPDANHDAR